MASRFVNIPIRQTNLENILTVCRIDSTPFYDFDRVVEEFAEFYGTSYRNIKYNLLKQLKISGKFKKVTRRKCVFSPDLYDFLKDFFA